MSLDHSPRQLAAIEPEQATAPQFAETPAGDVVGDIEHFKRIRQMKALVAELGEDAVSQLIY